MKDCILVKPELLYTPIVIMISRDHGNMRKKLFHPYAKPYTVGP